MREESNLLPPTAAWHCRPGRAFGRDACPIILWVLTAQCKLPANVRAFFHSSFMICKMARRMLPPAFLLSLLFFLAAEPSAVLAQAGQQLPRAMPVSIHGQVRYAQGGATAENVLVRLESLSGGVVAQVRTDHEGKFDFPNISQAMYRVTATAEGFRAAFQEVDLTTSTSQYVIFTLIGQEGLATKPVYGTEVIMDAKVPKEAREEYEKGRLEIFDRADPSKGIPHLEEAVKIYPDFLQAHLLLGTAYMDTRQMEKAEVSLKRVLEIDPTTAQAFLALGEVYREKKRYPEAEKALLEGLKLNDASWQGHITLGRLYLDIGNVQKAGAEIGRTLQLTPDAAEAYVFAGNIFLKATKEQEALQMFTHYLQLAPKGRYAEQTRKVVEKLKKRLEIR